MQVPVMVQQERFWLWSWCLWRLLVLADRDQTGRVGTDGSDPRGDRGASESGRSESVSQSVRSGLTQ